jgi:putative tryptophan/tyrosine transport system substrate-binding protein
MRRREFIALVGGAAALPLAARAQHSAPLIGFLSSRSPEDSKPHLAGFLRGLEAFGYVDGKTATIEYRWAKGQYDQLPKLASELANLHPTDYCRTRWYAFGACSKTSQEHDTDLFCH